MSRPIAIVAILLTTVVVVCAVGYIYLNRRNLYVWEIIIGSVAISLLLGVVPSLIHNILEKETGVRSIVLFMIVTACLAVLIAILVYLSNVPKSIREEIPVTYLLSPRKKELPYGLRFASTTTSACYLEAMWIFKRFKEMSPGNAKKIEEMAKAPGQEDFVFARKFFQNLTEYLLAYYMAMHFTTDEANLTWYRKETPKWLGFPHEDIAGKGKPLEAIGGDFRDNIFYGIKGHSPKVKLELRFPKGTEINLDRENLSSTLTIKNKFMVAKIGVFFSIMGSQSFGFLHESTFLPYGSDKEELAKAFRRYDTIIYYDVTFSKRSYGYPEMKYYEEWAKDLFTVLERKFRWGSPALEDEIEILRRYPQTEEKGKEE